MDADRQTAAPAPLDERKRAILRAVVEGYIRSGEPVGSKTVAERSGLGVSAATIRNEMAILEREGYISHPHTSAGRVPTDKGYRYYVDTLATPAAVAPERRREIERFLLGTLTALDELLQRASVLLAEITQYTALAAAPPMTEARLRWLELVPLGGTRVFLILVGEGARHEEHVLELPSEPTQEGVRRAVERANRLVQGRPLGEAADLLEKGAQGEEGEILRAVAGAVRSVATRARVFTGGAAHLVGWEPPTAAQRILAALEGGEVTPLFPRPQPEKVDVRIGSELPLEDLHDLSLIVAGYELGRRGAGALGVLGPTRMDYPTVIATVAAVARSVSLALKRLESS